MKGLFLVCNMLIERVNSDELTGGRIDEYPISLNLKVELPSELILKVNAYNKGAIDGDELIELLNLIKDNSLSRDKE